MATGRGSHSPVILIVEDEFFVRHMLSDTLVEEGYRVILAVSGDHAVALLCERPDVRILITDVNLPGQLQGFALARAVDERWPEIGIVVTSGAAFPGPGELPRKARFVPKPYSLTKLLRDVAALLDSAPGAISAHLPTIAGAEPDQPPANTVHAPSSGQRLAAAVLPDAALEAVDAPAILRRGNP